MLTKSKSMLLKSIAMIVTLIMVVCVCLTACADQSARDTAKEAKEIAEKAQTSIDDSLKDYVKKEEVSKMIEDALNKFMTGDGLTMVTNAMKSEAGSKVISDAVSAAIDEKIAGLQTEEEVKKLITDALTAPDSALNTKITEALSGYMTEESAKTLVGDALDEFLKNKINGEDGAINKALEDYKSVVSGLVEEKIGSDVSTYLKSDEAQQLIADCFSKYQADGLQNAIDAAAKIVIFDKRVNQEHWTREDKKTLDTNYKKYIQPILEVEGSSPKLDATGETSIVKLLYLITVRDQATLRTNVSAFEDVISGLESLEQAAGKVVANINELGLDINADSSFEEFVKAHISEFATDPSKLGYVIAVEENGSIYYYGDGNFAKLGELKDDVSVYRDFDLIVDTLYFDFYKVAADGSYGESLAKLVVANLADLDAVKEINDALQAIVDKFGKDYPEIVTVIPATPDDLRTEENESELNPEKRIFNGAAMLDGKLVVVNYLFFDKYQTILNTVQDSAKLTLDAIDAFHKRAGENGENITKDCKDTWAEYAAVIGAYKKYNDSRFESEVEGVKKAYEDFIKYVDEKVAAAVQTEKEAELKRLQAAYDAKLAELDKAYWAKVKNDIDPLVLKMATDYRSPIYGISINTEESVELMQWAEDFHKNYTKLLEYTVKPYEHAIENESILAAALTDLDLQFNGPDGFMAQIDEWVAPHGYVQKALDEIDARYWFSFIQEREAKRVEKALETFATDYNVKGWDVGDAQDIFHIAQKLVKKAADSIRNYTVDTTKEYPYSTALKEFMGLLDTKEDLATLLAPMEKFFDTRFTAFGDAPTIGSATAEALKVSEYVRYFKTKQNDLKGLHDLLLNNYNPDVAAGEVEGEYEPFKQEFEKIYNKVSATIADVKVVDDDYAQALADIDAAYEKAARELHLEVYRMKIERAKIKTNQEIGSILNDYYRNGSFPEMSALYGQFYKKLIPIVTEYATQKVPAYTIDQFYEGTEGMTQAEADEYACNKAVDTIKAQTAECMKALANVCYKELLIAGMSERVTDVNKFYDDTMAAATGVDGGAFVDAFKLVERLKNEIDAIVDGDAVLTITATTSTTAFTAEYKAAYDAKLAELDAAVSAFKAMLPIAIEGTNDLLEAKANNIELAEADCEGALADYANFDYMGILKSDLTKLKNNIGKVEIKIDENITVDQATLEAAIDAALTEVDDLYTQYVNDLNAYKALMDQYKANIEKLEYKKTAIINQIEVYLQTYMVGGSGRLVPTNPEIYWTSTPDVFEEGSPIEKGLRAAIAAIKSVKLEMVKDANAGTYYTPDEAFANATKKAIYNDADPDNIEFVSDGGALWMILKANIVDEVESAGKTSTGITLFLYTLNRDYLNA